MIKKGDTFNRLKVIEINVEPPKEKEYAKKIGRWHKCKCICNNIVIVSEMSLLNGSSKSCGCLKKEKAKEQIEINRKKMIENGNSTVPITRVSHLNYNGEKKTLTQWAKDIGISKQALSKRLKNKTVEEALTMKGKNK